MEKEFLQKEALKAIRSKENKNIDESESRLNLNDNSNVFTEEVKPLSNFQYFCVSAKNICIKTGLFIYDWVKTIIFAIINIFVSVYKIIRYGSIGLYKFFKDLCHKFKFNDVWGRLSYLIFGMGSFGHGQYVNGALYIIFQIGYILFFSLVGVNTIQGVWNLGDITVDPNWAFSAATPNFKFIADNSLLLLIGGLFTLISLGLYFYIWYRSIISGYNNYRIANFSKYNDINEKLIPMANEIDEYIAKVYDDAYESKGETLMELADLTETKELMKDYFSPRGTISKTEPIVRATKFSHSIAKKELKELFEKYLAETADKFEAKYIVYAFNETIKDSIRYHKERYHLTLKKEKLEVKENYLLKVHSLENSAISEDKELSEEAKEKKLDAKIIKDKKKEHKVGDKLAALTKTISENEKVYSPYVSKLSRVNYNSYAKFNDYFITIAKYNEDIKFYEHYVELKEYYNSVGGNFERENAKNADKKVELQKEATEKLATLNARYEEVYQKKAEIEAKIKELKIEMNDKTGKKPVLKERALRAQFNHEIAKLLKEFDRVSERLDALAFDKKAYKNYINESAKDLSNEMSKKEAIKIVTDKAALKIEEVNNKYDAIHSEKAEIFDKIVAQKKACELLVKNMKKNNCKLGKEETAEIEKEYQERINKLDGQYNAFASNKLLKTLQKEEIRLIKKRLKDDIKYLKTNYTDVTYASTEVVNKMIVDFDFEYRYAKKHVADIRKTADIVEAKELSEQELVKLKEEKASYIEEHGDKKFVGKSKSFVNQIKSLFNDKFHVTILTLPVLGATLFCIIPLLFSILIAFTNFDRDHLINIAPFEWTGFDTFIRMFQGNDPIYGAIGAAIGQTFVWTLIWAVLATFTNYFLGIIVALMINKEGIKFKKLWRTLFVLTIAVPAFISLSTIAKMLADGGTGVLANIYKTISGTDLRFATDRTNDAFTTKLIIIIVNIWVGIPYTVLSTTGILMNIPKDLYESSRIDGAGPATQFFKITMPYILFVTGPSLITTFIGNFNNFGVIYFLTAGGPSRYTGAAQAAIAPGYTDLFITYIYTLVTGDSYKYYNVASSLGIIIFIVCSFISIILYNKTGAVAKEDQFQ